MQPKNPHAKGAGASHVAGYNAEALSNPAAGNPMIVDRAVTIGRDDKGLYLVTVSPPCPDHEPRLFDNYKEARGYAGGLRMVHRWAIQDEAEGAR
jgi:hypothetical protein